MTVNTFSVYTEPQAIFFRQMRDALREGGIVCTQGESLWLHIDTIKEMMSFCQELFTTVEYANISIPTYPAGQIGFVICSKTSGSIKVYFLHYP